MQNFPKLRRWLLPIALATLTATAMAAPVSVLDDSSQRIRLTAPAQRIISLSPHATELIYAAGAGGKLVGVDRYSDWPQAAQAITKIGQFGAYDLERIVALQPDLIVGWRSGLSGGARERIAALGIPLFESEPASLADIISNIRRLGELAGSAALAGQATQRLQTRLDKILAPVAKPPPLRIFLQVGDSPLMALGEPQIMSQALQSCGGANIFAARSELAAVVSREAVIAADPQIIFAGTRPGNHDPLAQWQAWPQLAAVRHRALVALDADAYARPTPRMFDVVERACAAIASQATKPGTARP